MRFTSSSLTISSSFFARESGSESGSLVSSSFNINIIKNVGSLEPDFTNNKIEFIIPSQSAGGTSDVKAITISASGNNPRIGIGLDSPKSTFDFKDASDSTTGAEFLIRSARSTQGALSGDEGGSINFVIDSGSFNNIKTSGSLAKIRTKVNSVGTTGVQGKLIFELSKGALVSQDAFSYGFNQAVGGGTTSDFNLYSQIQTASLLLKDFASTGNSVIEMLDSSDNFKLQIGRGNITASGDISASGEVSANTIVVGSTITHIGDSNTKIEFSNDDINLTAAGKTAIDITYDGDGGGDTREITFNESHADIDVRIEGDTDTDLFFTNAGTDRVGIGTNSPNSKLEVDGDITATHITASGAIKASNLSPRFTYIYSASSGAQSSVDSGKVELVNTVVDYILVNTSSFNGVDLDGSSVSNNYASFLYNEVGSLITLRNVHNSAFITYKVTNVITDYSNNPGVVYYQIDNVLFDVSSGSLSPGDEVEFIWDKSAGVGGAYNADQGASTKILAGILKPGYNYLDVFFGTPTSDSDYTTGGPSNISAVLPSASYTEPKYLLPAIAETDSLTLGGLNVNGHITASGNISASGGGTHVLGGNLQVYGSIRSIGSDVILENGNITVTGNISGSSSSTGSFAHIITEGETIEFKSAGTKLGSIKADAAGSITFGGDSTEKASIKVADVGATSGNHNIRLLKGNITASGNISASGKFIGSELSALGDLTLDADGADIILKDGGTDFGRFKRDSSDFIIKSETNNKDIAFRGQDGGATITALTLDMSEAGSATFNSHITASGNISSSGDVISNTLDTKTNKLAKTSNTDADHQGDVVFFGGTTSMTAGRIYHFKSDGTWELANPNSSTTSDGLLAVALGAASDTNGMLLKGMVTLNHDPGAVGDVLFLDEQQVDSAYGAATSGAPAGTGDVVRIIGYCLDASNGQIYFNPSNDFIIHS